MQSLDKYLLSASYVSGTEPAPQYIAMKQIWHFPAFMEITV